MLDESGVYMHVDNRGPGEEVLGKWTDGGKLGLGFAMLAIIVLIALVVQLTFLRPKTDNME